jgi:hypothetical protein
MPPVVTVNAETNPHHPDEKVYVVVWQDSVEERSDEVAAHNAGEAVWLIHTRHNDPGGAQYNVVPADATEPARNFTVGHNRQEAPFSD